ATSSSSTYSKASESRKMFSLSKSRRELIAPSGNTTVGQCASGSDGPRVPKPVIKVVDPESNSSSSSSGGGGGGSGSDQPSKSQPAAGSSSSSSVKKAFRIIRSSSDPIQSKEKLSTRLLLYRNKSLQSLLHSGRK